MGMLNTKPQVSYKERFPQVITIPVAVYNLFNPQGQPRVTQDAMMPIWCFIEMMLVSGEATQPPLDPATQMRTSPFTILQSLGVDCSALSQDKKMDKNSVILSRELFGTLVNGPNFSTQESLSLIPDPLNGKTFEDYANEDGDSVISAQTSQSASSVGNKSTTSRTSSKSKSGHHKTTNEKVNATLINMASQRRVKAIALFKELLVNQTHFEAVFSSSGIAQQQTFVACIFNIIHDLLKDIGNGNQKNTVQIIQEASIQYSADVATVFIRSFSTQLDSLYDQKPTPSALDSVMFYSRFYTALTTNQTKQQFFGTFFNIELIKQPENFKLLGKAFGKISQNILKVQFATCLSPLCNAAIQILRNISKTAEDGQAARFHLIAQLIYQTTVLNKTVHNVLLEHLDNALARAVITQLNTNYTDLTDSLNTQPSLQEKIDFFSCVSFMLRELPRQVESSSKTNVDFVAISKRPENRSICSQLELKSAELTQQLKEEEKNQKLPGIQEGTSSQESTPVKAKKGDNAPFFLTMSLTSGLNMQMPETNTLPPLLSSNDDQKMGSESALNP